MVFQLLNFEIVEYPQQVENTENHVQETDYLIENHIIYIVFLNKKKELAFVFRAKNKLFVIGIA